MAGLFDSILARSGRPDWMPTADAAFPELATTRSLAADEAAAADAAAVKEAQMRERRRFALPDKRPDILNPAAPALVPPATGLSGIAPSDPSLYAQPAGVQLAMNDARAGTGVPFSTQAGMLAPPITAAPGEPVPDPTVLPAPGSVPTPRSRPPEADITGPTDVGARGKTVGAPMQIAPQAAPEAQQEAPVESPFQLPSILDKIRTTLGDNSNTLLAIGAGFAGAPNIGQAISRASGAAIPARAADIKQSLERQTHGYTTKALIEAGVPVQQAIAAQADPDLKKALIQNYITDRKNEIKTVKSKDMFGNESERLIAVNPFDLSQKEITGGGAAPAGGKNASFAPGVSMENFDGSKSGDEYLGQFAPEVQAGVKAYLRGDALPGKPAIDRTIKMVAQKYGDDMGIPANDQDYVARKNFKASLGDIKGGVGMAVKGFQQGTSHLAAAADKMVKLGNINAGLTDVGNVINNIKNRTAKQGGIAAALDTDAQALAGEVGKLYSGSNGGGVHEREATKKLFGNPNGTAEQQAGVLEATLHLMEGGLTTIEGRKRALFRDQQIPGGDFIGAEERKNIESVKNAIKILRGEAVAPAASTAKPAAAPAAKGAVKIGDQVIPWSVN